MKLMFWSGLVLLIGNLVIASAWNDKWAQMYAGATAMLGVLIMWDAFNNNWDGIAKSLKAWVLAVMLIGAMWAVNNLFCGR